MGMNNNNFQEEIITALNALKENAVLTIDMSEKWQNERVIKLYAKDIELAEKLLETIEGMSMSKCSNWRTDEPPKNNKTILIDIDYPWPLVANWNEHEQQYVFANIQVNMMHGEWSDPYWESEYAHASEVKRWMPLPELPNGNQIKDNDEILKAREAV